MSPQSTESHPHPWFISCAEQALRTLPAFENLQECTFQVGETMLHKFIGPIRAARDSSRTNLHMAFSFASTMVSFETRLRHRVLAPSN